MLNMLLSTDCATAAHGEVAELLRQGPHHGGRLDGHGVVHSWRQDCPLLKKTKTYSGVSSCQSQIDRM